MKMFFEEPKVRVEKFTAESVMAGGNYQFMISFASTYDPDEDRTVGIKPY